MKRRILCVTIIGENGLVSRLNANRLGCTHWAIGAHYERKFDLRYFFGFVREFVVIQNGYKPDFWTHFLPLFGDYDYIFSIDSDVEALFSLVEYCGALESAFGELPVISQPTIRPDLQYYKFVHASEYKRSVVALTTLIVEIQVFLIKSDFFSSLVKKLSSSVWNEHKGSDWGIDWIWCKGAKEMFPSLPTCALLNRFHAFHHNFKTISKDQVFEENGKKMKEGTARLFRNWYVDGDEYAKLPREETVVFENKRRARMVLRSS